MFLSFYFLKVYKKPIDKCIWKVYIIISKRGKQTRQNEGQHQNEGRGGGSTPQCGGVYSSSVIWQGKGRWTE